MKRSEFKVHRITEQVQLISNKGTINKTHTKGAKAQIGEKNNPKELDIIKAIGKNK